MTETADATTLPATRAALPCVAAHTGPEPDTVPAPIRRLLADPRPHRPLRLASSALATVKQPSETVRGLLELYRCLDADSHPRDPHRQRLAGRHVLAHALERLAAGLSAALRPFAPLPLPERLTRPNHTPASDRAPGSQPDTGPTHARTMRSVLLIAPGAPNHHPAAAATA